MSGGETSYDVLEARFGQIGALGEAARVLTWDRSVNMPRKGAPGRAEQLASLRRVVHEKITDPAMPDLLDAAAEEVARDPWRGANLREMRRRWIHASALDADLIAAMARADSECEMAWRDAREADDYEAVKPCLRTVLELVRRTGEARAEALDCSLYDALMDVYEPGARTGRIDALFDDLAGFLPGFLGRVLQTQAGEPQPLPLDGPVQRRGAAFAGRTADGPARVRFRGRPSRRQPAPVLQRRAGRHPRYHPLRHGGLHAERHGGAARDRACALQRRAAAGMAPPARWIGSRDGDAREPVADNRDAGVPFGGIHRIPRAAGARLPSTGAGPAWSADNLRRHYRRVARSLIRVDADEVTYPAHVILRYRLERELIGGGLSLDDLPGAWADGLEEPSGDPAARRRQRLPAGHSLVQRDVGLFPDLCAGRARGGTALRDGPGRPARNTRRALQGGLHAAARLAAGGRPSEGVPAGDDRRSASGGDRHPARHRLLQAPPGEALPVRPIEARRRFPSCRRQGCPRRSTGGRDPRSRAGAPAPSRRSRRSGSRGSRNWRSRRAHRS